MKKTAKLSPQGRAPMPLEFAALQNLQPSFFQSLSKLGFEVVLVRIDTNKNTPPGAIDERVKAELENAVQSIKAGELDSEFYPLFSECFFFHVRRKKLGAAIRAIKEALEARGVLRTAEIFHAESPDFLMQWHPPTAQGVNLESE